MRRETQNVLLVLFGGALCKLAWTGGYLRYVKPSLLPFLIGAGVVMLALWVITIWRDMRAGSTVPGEHDHTGRSPWLLMLPVLTIFLVAPPALGADAVSHASQATIPQRPITRLVPLPPGPVVALPMSELLTRAVRDNGDTLNGRQLELIGFIVHGKQDATYLARMVISCCAAAATPAKVHLDGYRGLASLPQDGWFKVRGQIVPASASAEDRFIPSFTVSSLRPIPVPAEPYEY